MKFFLASFWVPTYPGVPISQAENGIAQPEQADQFIRVLIYHEKP